MSAFSFSHFSSCYLCLLLVVALFHVCLSNQNSDDFLCIREERQALLEFKHHLIDEGDRLASWVGEKTDCCRWSGIVCDNMTGHVHQIHLPGLNGHCHPQLNFLGLSVINEFEQVSKQQLKGNLSPSLLGLKQLKHLDLSCNDFGQIQVPEFIGSLGNLRYLNLSSSSYSGLIPPQLGNLSKLHTLCLGSFQDLWGESTRVMNMEWLSNLRLLRHLDMSYVDLRKATDWFQVINTLPSLTELHLKSSHLMDVHPHAPSLNITSLLLLDLSGNQFTNSLMPRWIFSITSLVSLDLSECDFNGLIPSSSAHSFRNLTSLKWLHVSRNTFMNSSLVLKELSSGTGSNLISLDISICDISSTALDSLHNLTSLLSLDLSSNLLTNVLPKSLGNFCNLRDIDLSSNYFENVSLTYLLESFFECKSPRLESLSISNSGRSGHLPNQLGQLMHMKHLDLFNNQISGPIPLCIGGLLLLEVLDLSSNQLNGSLPDSIGRLSFLKKLHLSQNQLNGSLPNSIGRLSLLREIDLSSNNFQNISLTSLLESFLECKSPRLEYLSISRSGFSGRIPDSIGRLSLLEVLDLSFNQLNGSLPDSIGRLSLLKKLDLSDNQFNGSLPYSLGQLSKLEKLDFSSNFLTGVVTETHFVKLVRLKVLDGGGNNLILRPRLANWIPPFQLERLYLNSWSLGPQFPSWLISQRELTDLDISNTNISSPMPESFVRSFPNLEWLDVSKNQMQGTLNLSGIPALYLLDLSSNRFGGELPDISNGSILGFLDLSNNLFVGSLHHLLCSDGVKPTGPLNLGNNNLSGVIPDCWEKWQSLYYLNLENNNFSGGIPRTLGHLGNINILNMRGNKLEGKLPASLMNLTDLKILDLSGNELAGSIPSWIGTEMSFLRLLNLRSNKFVGKIPHEVCYLTDIQILDLSNNKLMGDIPKCFNSFSVLSGKEAIVDDQFSLPMYEKEVINSDSLVMKGHEYIYSTILDLVRLLDLSNNKLVGHIPSELTTLIMLQSLNLSRNHLTGRIPEKIGYLKELESFDLSLNKLSGELPMSLSSLNLLSSFNVSYNNLTGEIPSSTQLQSLNESCFVGNKLCGDPLSEPCSRVETPDTDQEEDDGSHGVDWGLIISVVSGFVVGFWVILAPLIVSRSWRIAYFRFLSELMYMVYDVTHKMFSR
ncbi:leucine-rich repeat protein [Artemisia annua]|uniref:Leucine-rich repeat protein n=1 Tax=Artemisia annua TaxID=35608 RepID=A0A2U1KQH2_ARTAN|nr:leucine-rich repeat protein [Artemisia annua]